MNRVRDFFHMPPVTVVSRDIDLVRDTSRLRIKENTAKQRNQEKMDKVDDLYRRTLNFVKDNEGGRS